VIDYHIHIGQFNEVYYDAYEVFQAIESSLCKTGVTEVHYSSTSSCRDDVELCKIEEEIAYAQNFSSKSLVVKPYLWYVPKYAEQNISVKSALQAFDYCGVKLHPFAQSWDFSNPKHKKALEEIFECCTDSKSILIHCSKDKSCVPNRFEEFFKNFPDTNVILAHSNPVEETVEMLRKYKKIKSDIAYADEENIQKIMNSDVKEKVLFGTDFPVTHYFNNHLFNKKISLKKEYLEDCSKIRFFYE
jgi:uncharacterized protein